MEFSQPYHKIRYICIALLIQNNRGLISNLVGDFGSHNWKAEPDGQRLEAKLQVFI